MKFYRKERAIGQWLCLFCITLGAVFSRFWQLSQSPYLSGADAYYYALQIKFFHITGAFKITDSSPLLYLMGWTAKSGLSFENTVILWNVLIQIGCAYSLWLAWRLNGTQKNYIGYLIFTWAIVSPSLFFTCIEFPRYAFSFIFFSLWPAGLLDKRFKWLSVTAVVCSCASHLVMTGILVVILAGLVLRFFIGSKPDMLRKPKNITGAILLVLAAGVFFSRYILSSDINRIRFDSFQPGLWTFLNRATIPFSIKAEVVIAMILGVSILIPAFRDRTKSVSRFWAPFIILLLIMPLGSAEVMGIAERLCLMIPLVILALLPEVEIKLSGWGKALFYPIISVFLLSVICFPGRYLELTHPGHLNPDYRLYHKVTQAVGGRRIPMLIVHQGLNYFYKYRTMRESFPYEPESHWPKKKIWRIVYGVTPSQWAYYLPDKYLWGSGLLFDLPGPYSLVREDCWNIFRNRVWVGNDQELIDLVCGTWLNPSQKRPEFTRKRSKPGDSGEFSAYPNNRENSRF